VTVRDPEPTGRFLHPSLVHSYTAMVPAGFTPEGLRYYGKAGTFATLAEADRVVAPTLHLGSWVQANTHWERFFLPRGWHNGRPSELAWLLAAGADPADLKRVTGRHREFIDHWMNGPMQATEEEIDAAWSFYWEIVKAFSETPAGGDGG
jgi:hypothetical protein